MDCTKVCRNWYELAGPILWKDVYLLDHGLRAFAYTTPIKLNLRYIRSVTVKSIQLRSMLVTLGALNRLNLQMQSMSGLVSFSCSMSLVG